MVKPKIEKVKKIILLLYFAVFPFGQLPALLITLAVGSNISIHPTDILIALYVLLSFLSHPQLARNFVSSYLAKLFCMFVFSFVIGFVVFHFTSAEAILYFIRFTIYLLFGFIVWVERPVTKKNLSYFFIATAIFISVFGIIQYLFLPDTRFLKILGWDDHYYRLLSSFLDPAFTAILLVFAILYMSFRWKTTNVINKTASICLVSISLLLTYSRASYLSLLVGVVTYFFVKSKISLKYIACGLLFVGAIFLLPRPGGEGVKLERTFSLFLKIQNSIETTHIFALSPVYGVGYNNICIAREKLISQSLTTANYSHSCSGADNSFLFMLSTLGIVGTLSGIWGAVNFIKKLNSPVIYATVAALVVHAQFTNTLFYPWVYVWILFLVVESVLTEKT